MRLIRIHGPDDVRMDDVLLPVVGSRDVLIKTAACGICGTDLSMVRYGSAALGLSSPLPLGHEVSGVVEQAGSDVSAIVPGMRVIVNPMGTDGIIGNGGPEGAFVDKLLVRNALLGQSLFQIPEDISFDVAALCEPLAVALHAVNRAKIGSETRTIVFGAGPIGLCIILWLKHFGVASIVSVDISASRLQHAVRLGATEAILAGAGDLAIRLADIHGSEVALGKPAVGTDVYFDAAGGPHIVSDTIGMAKRGALIVLVALYWKESTIDFRAMLRKELTITTAAGYPEELPQVVAMLADIRTEAEKLISHRFEFDNFFGALRTAKDSSSAKVMVSFPQRANQEIGRLSII